MAEKKSKEWYCMMWKLYEIQTTVSTNSIKHSCTHSFMSWLRAAGFNITMAELRGSWICGAHRALHCSSVHHKSQWQSYKSKCFKCHIHILTYCDSVFFFFYYQCTVIKSKQEEKSGLCHTFKARWRVWIILLSSRTGKHCVYYAMTLWMC